MKKKNIQNDTLIAGQIDVTQWKTARELLISGILSDKSTDEEWRSAFQLLHTRIKTRFLDPIDWILEKGHDVGEGFSALAIQCILIEFLEALYQGRIYTTSSHPKLFEYNSSKELFSDFLLKRHPFCTQFKSKASANGFFDNIRCGLLHEAATKQTSKINRASNSGLLVEFEADDPSNMRVYRENFYNAIKTSIGEYAKKLSADKELQVNFIRKIDDICGIKHVYYFAYGSNMLPRRLIERLGKYHDAVPAMLPHHRFTYNKRSIDGSAKANLVKCSESKVFGACFEIDEQSLDRLQEHEQGYDRRKVKIFVGEKETSATTFISCSIDNSLTVKDEYRSLVLEGAMHWKLNADYISGFLR